LSSDRRLARAAAALGLLTVLAGTAACGTGAAADAAPAPTSRARAGTPADATTGRIAEVEFARQCTVAATNFADEAEFTTDLDARLVAAGFTHEQWKQWHDALDDSPELVTQYAALGAAGCPAG
jgi:hypothetical protein